VAAVEPPSTVAPPASEPPAATPAEVLPRANAAPTPEPAPPAPPPTAAPPPETPPAAVLAARQRARQQLAGGAREQALQTAATALRTAPTDRDLAGIVDQILRDARTQAERGRAEAARLNLSPASSSTLRRAGEQEAEARRLERRADGRIAAARAFWAARDLYGQAAAEAARAAAQPPAAVPTPAPRPADTPPVQQAAVNPPAPVEPPRPAPNPAPPAPQPEERRPASPPAAEPDRARPDPERAPAPASIAQDQQAVRMALGRYEAAYESLDIAAVRQVHPSLTAQQSAALARTFSDSRSYQLDIEDAQIDVEGTTATVTCRVRRTFIPKTGRSVSNVVPTVIRLARRGNAWIVTDVTAR
jgi:hypothetical protein